MFLTSQLLIHYVSLLVCLCPVALSTAIDISCLPCSCGLCSELSCSSACCVLFLVGVFSFLCFLSLHGFFSLSTRLTNRHALPLSLLMPLPQGILQAFHCQPGSKKTRAFTPPLKIGWDGRKPPPSSGRWCNPREAEERKEGLARGTTTASASWVQALGCSGGIAPP